MRGNKGRGALAAALLAGASLVPFGAQADEVQYAWTGLYVGAGGGYGGAHRSIGLEGWNYVPGGFFQTGDFPGEYPDGFDLYSLGAVFGFGGIGEFGTFEAGFDIQTSPRFVIGFLGGVDLSRITANGSIFGVVCYEDELNPDTDDCSNVEPSDEVEANIDFTLSPVWTVGGRVGLLANPQTLIYALAGYSRANLMITPSLESDLTGPLSAEPEQIPFHALTFGFGIETLLGPHLSAKLEYRGTVWTVDEQVFGDDVTGVRYFSDTYLQTIRGTLAYRFGAHPTPEGFDDAFDNEPVTWTGLHFGVGGGYGIVNHRAGFEVWDYTAGGLYQAGDFPGEYPDGFDAYSTGVAIDFGGRGPIGMVETGFDIQLGNALVIGTFADFTFAKIDTDFEFFGEVCYEHEITAPDDCDLQQISDEPSAVGTLRTGNMWTVGGRIGFLPNPRTLIYGLGGYTNIDFTVRGSLESDITGEVEGVSDPFSAYAITFGGGIETMLSPSLSAKLEYRATYLTTEFVYLTDPDVGGRIFDTSLIQTVRAGLSWRLGNGN